LNSDIDRDVLQIGYPILKHYDNITTTIRDIRTIKAALLSQNPINIAGVDTLLRKLDYELERKIKTKRVFDLVKYSDPDLFRTSASDF